MGALMWVSGQLKANKEIPKKATKKILAIRDGWDEDAFLILPGQDFIEFSKEEMGGICPFEDGVEKPLGELLSLAKEAGISLSGEILIYSNDCDMDNTGLVIEDNEIRYANSQVLNATTGELIEELISRGVLPKDFKEKKTA